MRRDDLAMVAWFLADQGSANPSIQGSDRITKAREAIAALERYLACKPQMFTGAQTDDGIDVPFQLRSVDFLLTQRWDDEKRAIVKEPSGFITVELRQMIEFKSMSADERAEREARSQRVAFEALQPGKPPLYREPTVKVSGH